MTLKFETELERDLWAMLYRSQLALAKRCLASANEKRLCEGDWPAGQEWYELSGSSCASFFRAARQEAGIDDDMFLGVLRENHDAGQLAEIILYTDEVKAKK